MTTEETAAGVEDSAKPKVNLLIDTIGACNLRCPSCPMGVWGGEDQVITPGVMSTELFEQVIDKACAELDLNVVCLFNWSEPLLNPRLPEMVKILRERDLTCGISSNLNILRNADELMSSGVSWFRVSLSGFNQEVYERGHVRGDIEKVKANMRTLAEARNRQEKWPYIQVFFHKYCDNEADEALMKEYAESLNFDFTTGWAYVCSVEKLLTLTDPDNPVVNLTKDDHLLLDRLALKVDQALDLTGRHKVKSCTYLEDYLVLDVKADAYLCCAVTGSPSNMVGSYLELPFDEIQKRRRKHSLCGPCMKKGLPVLFDYADPGFDEIASAEREKYQAAVKV